MSQERFITPCPLPEEYERELLTILIEECAEVQQRATKLLRFGRDETQPGQPETNRTRLSTEMGDLLAIYESCVEAGLISEEIVREQMPKKKVKMAKYMQTAHRRAQ